MANQPIDVIVEGRTVYMGSSLQAGSMFDNAYETFEFVGLPMLDANQTVSLHWIVADGGSYGSVETLTQTTYGWSYTVSSNMSNYPKVVAFIRITADETIWNTKSFYITLNKLPVIDGSIPGIPSTNVIQQALDILNQGIGDIGTATAAANDAASNANGSATQAITAAERAVEATTNANAAATSASQVMTRVMAPEFSTETNYNIGDYVIYNNVLYKFIAEHTAGAWSSSDVTFQMFSDSMEQLENIAVAEDDGQGNISFGRTTIDNAYTIAVAGTTLIFNVPNE